MHHLQFVVVNHPNIAELITALAAAAAAVAAWAGLNAWRNQLHGNKDHEIAWKYLEATLKLRNAINNDVRNPAIFPGESQSAAEEFYGKDKMQSELTKNPNAWQVAVYSLRWREVVKARKELNDALVQAEIWWGKKAVGLEKDLNACIGILYVNMKNYVEPDRGLRWDDDVLYYIESDEESEFNKKLNAAIKKMDDFARPFLRASKS